MRVSTHYFQARILWLQGFAGQALRVVEHNIEEGNVVGQALSYCSVLGQAACPIAFWVGHLDAAERYGALLRDHTERHPSSSRSTIGLPRGSVRPTSRRLRRFSMLSDRVGSSPGIRPATHSRRCRSL